MTSPSSASGDATVATIVLAAGGSSRMVGGHKLLETLAGRPVIAWAVDAALDAEVGPVVVVTGDRSREVSEALPGEVTVLENDGWRSGMAASLRVGVASLPEDVDAFAVALGDMPLVRAVHYRSLARAWIPRSVVVPVHRGRRGHPVVWSRSFAREMADLDGDRGARTLVERHKGAVIEVPIGDPGVLMDVDTRAHLADVRSLLEER